MSPRRALAGCARTTDGGGEGRRRQSFGEFPCHVRCQPGEETARGFFADGGSFGEFIAYLGESLLVGLEGVAEVYSISGEHDIMAIIRVKEYDSLAQVVSGTIASIPGITHTVTQMAFRCYSKHDMEKMWAQYIAE